MSVIKAHRIDPTAQPADTYGTYKSILTLAIIGNVVVGLAMLLHPGWVVETLGLAPVHPLAWVRYAGVSILVLTVVYIPVRIAPQAHKALGLYTGLLRFVYVILFLSLGGGFYVFAAFDSLFGLLLLTSYWNAFQAELASFP